MRHLFSKVRRLPPRLLNALLTVAAMLGAYTLTFVWPQQSGLDIDIDSSSRARAIRTEERYDLTELRILNRVIVLVKGQYVEPQRIKPKRMLLAGLNAIQSTVAPVLVNYSSNCKDHAEGCPTFSVRVGKSERTFRIDDVISPWALALRFRDVFAFLQKHLVDEDIDLKEIEYAAINGMLRTLDPHSVLLIPSVYQEMRMSTRGEFGGLGIVISIRDGQLTVIKPMPNTPAAEKGIKRGDRIVKVNEESTLNMPLQEAVNRLRGAPKSKVSIWVTRDSEFKKPKKFLLTRAVIQIPSVESRMLKDGVGYVRIKNFQGNTYRDLTSSLSKLHKSNLRGLVLDLRDNPGGLLDQAVLVADAFLPSGTIVTTSSADPSQRKKELAHLEKTEPNYPMVVLTNGGSASASEIVAGALKNHDRAVVIGQRTFGKGSVQVLHDFPEDGSALKLTIAQYLTPGEVSIQGVGVEPDIGIDPMTIDPIEMDLAADQTMIRESDLSRHLTHAKTDTSKGPGVTLRYFLPTETRLRLQDVDLREVEENEHEDEFLTRFSRELLVHSKGADRRVMLKDSKAVIDKIRDEEMQKSIAELKKLGVDWSAEKATGAAETEVKITTNRPSNQGVPGEPFDLTVSLTNKGSQPLYRLRALTKSDFPLFDGRELVFGRVKPGETRTWTTTLGICAPPPSVTLESGQPNAKQNAAANQRICSLPRDLRDRADGIKVEFFEANDRNPKPGEVRTTIRSLPRPQFAYSVQVTDDEQGNGDGLLQRGESGRIYLRIRNVGEGRTFKTETNLSNRSGSGILLKKGRFNLDSIKPGEEKTVGFTLTVLPEFEKEEAELEVSIIDPELLMSMREVLKVKIAGEMLKVTPNQKAIKVKSDTLVYEQPNTKSKIIAQAKKGGVKLQAEVATNGFIRVRSGMFPGWVRAADVSDTAKATGTLDYIVNHMPPKLELTGETLVTRQPQITIQGRALDEQSVKDVYAFVGAQKVFYRPNDTNDKRSFSFSSAIPLRPGINYVTVVAREDREISSKVTYVIRRDGPRGELLKTPPYDDDLWGEIHQGEELNVPQ